MGQIPVLVPTSFSSVEFPGVLTWSDTLISCGDVKKFFTENFHEDFDTRKSAIGIQVKVELGPTGLLGVVTKSSNVYSVLGPPATPTDVKIEAR
jgi:hypothetical protein